MVIFHSYVKLPEGIFPHLFPIWRFPKSWGGTRTPFAGVHLCCHARNGLLPSPACLGAVGYWTELCEAHNPKRCRIAIFLYISYRNMKNITYVIIYIYIYIIHISVNTHIITVILTSNLCMHIYLYNIYNIEIYV